MAGEAEDRVLSANYLGLAFGGSGRLASISSRCGSILSFRVRVEERLYEGVCRTKVCVLCPR